MTCRVLLLSLPNAKAFDQTIPSVVTRDLLPYHADTEQLSMTTRNDDIASALAVRDRWRRRLASGETPEQRLMRLSDLHRSAVELLRSSPESWQHFLRRNFKSRRVEVIDGQWRPVSADRCSYRA